MFNMLFADVLTLYIPEFAKGIVAGTTPVEITEELMLAMAVFIEIPIAMIFFSRVLDNTANRRANTSGIRFTSRSGKRGPRLGLLTEFAANENRVITQTTQPSSPGAGRRLLHCQPTGASRLVISPRRISSIALTRATQIGKTQVSNTLGTGISSRATPTT